MEGGRKTTIYGNLPTIRFLIFPRLSCPAGLVASGSSEDRGFHYGRPTVVAWPIGVPGRLELALLGWLLRDLVVLLGRRTADESLSQRALLGPFGQQDRFLDLVDDIWNGRISE